MSTHPSSPVRRPAPRAAPAPVAPSFATAITIANLKDEIISAEHAAGMTPADILRAECSMAWDIASRPGESEQIAMLAALHTLLAALHTRLCDARDFPAEREADARLRAKLGMAPRPQSTVRVPRTRSPSAS